MALETILKDAAAEAAALAMLRPSVPRLAAPRHTSLGHASRTNLGLSSKKVIPEEVRQTIAKETRRALRDHEDELTTLVKAAVGAAIAEMLNGRAVK